MSEDPRRDDAFDEDDAFEEGMSFDELSRELAAGNITRRRALKLFGASVLASLLPASLAEAAAEGASVASSDSAAGRNLASAAAGKCAGGGDPAARSAA